MDSWDEVVQPSKNNKIEPDYKKDEVLKTNSENLEDLILLCLNELKVAHETKYEEDKAVRTAALFLKAQLLLSNFIKDVDLRAKQMKREVKRIEGEKYFHYRDNSELSKKLTEVALGHLINKDGDVISAAIQTSEAEAEAKRLDYIYGILKDGHVFFRNIGKSKSPWSE